MRVYYNHTGQKGAAEDFPKTVARSVAVDQIIRAFDEYVLTVEVAESLREAFPSGYANCWGLPTGAGRKINRLMVGDLFFLVRTTSDEGDIPVMGQIRAFWNAQLPALSTYLWQNPKFKYVFFFEAEWLNLTWVEFRDMLGINPNMTPRGTTDVVADRRFESFGGTEAFMHVIRERHSRPGELMRGSLSQASGIPLPPPHAVRDAHVGPPKLTNDEPLEVISVERTKRMASFREQVKLLYRHRCAICNAGLIGISGEHEVEAAHIYPHGMNGRDDIRNGLCLCRRHHWLLDVGLIAISDDCEVLVNPLVSSLEAYAELHSLGGLKVQAPEDVTRRPHPVFLQAHRKLHGFP